VGWYSKRFLHPFDAAHVSIDQPRDERPPLIHEIMEHVSPPRIPVETMLAIDESDALRVEIKDR
jgi:hypothetical protein